ncbi:MULTISPECIES: 2'-5' RNA ligase family protein [unclassified Streptomyces]|uniref:2'-5' RNA ligase family protein n=1 Tax=unclassified Streptomyces TaxID=2593676 RepID=UPI001EF09859|nr:MULTISPECIES: 2'-5' RNA ligase family protein [unclassified Streptomyces]
MTTHPVSDGRMANHWWWRPGWQMGSRFLTFHFTFQQAPDVHRLASLYRHALADVDGLNLVPDTWLHLTTQGLGFSDDVPDGDVQAILSAAADRLSHIPAFDVTLDRPEITPEAIRWEATPSGPPTAVRSALRDAIGSIWDAVPEPDDGFTPHVSIAYSNSTGPDDPVRAALDAVETHPATARLDQVELIVLNRDQQMYEWETYAQLPLGRK